MLGAPDGPVSKFGEPKTLYGHDNSLPHTHTQTQTHQALLPHAAHLDNYLPQVRVHRDNNARAATGGTAPGRADGSHSGGSEEKKRWRSDGVCVCGQGDRWVCAGVGKHQGELASERQASWQAYSLLIMQGLPLLLGAVSNMRRRNQPLKNRSPQSATIRVLMVNPDLRSSHKIF